LFKVKGSGCSGSRSCACAAPVQRASSVAGRRANYARWVSPFDHPYPNAQIVEPLEIALDNLPTIVESARTLARERGKSLLAWWVAPEHDELGARLEGVGLVNKAPRDSRL
jgi:hypothetical protein